MSTASTDTTTTAAEATVDQSDDTPWTNPARRAELAAVAQANVGAVNGAAYLSTLVGPSDLVELLAGYAAAEQALVDQDAKYATFIEAVQWFLWRNDGDTHNELIAVMATAGIPEVPAVLRSAAEEPVAGA